MGCIARKWVHARYRKNERDFFGFQLRAETLTALYDGEFLCKAKYLNIDSRTKTRMKNYPLNVTLPGMQIAEIIASKNNNFPIGRYVAGPFGWRDLTICDNELEEFDDVYLLPDLWGLPLSLGLSVLGQSGITAYFGFLEVCQPKIFETVVVSDAGSDIGSHVCQIAKIYGCKVIAFIETASECKWLKDDLKLDCVFKFNTTNIENLLNKHAAAGIDCFFDNVGGLMSHFIMKRMNKYGRIALCRSKIPYNDDLAQLPILPMVQSTFVEKQLKMEGFCVQRWCTRWKEGFDQNLKWIQEGKIKYVETIIDGFEKAPNELLSPLNCKNIGNVIIRV